MIGVISKPTQLEAVEEFLQLFKTPWEFFRPGEAYSVVIATTGEVSNVRTKLLPVYGPETKSIDALVGVTPGKRLESSFLTHRERLRLSPWFISAGQEISGNPSSGT